MKTSFTMLALATLVSSFAFQAYANSSVDQQRRAEADTSYWHDKSENTSANQQKGRAVANSSQDNMVSGVSQYPCAKCVYDESAGGYVLSPHLKR